MPTLVLRLRALMDSDVQVIILLKNWGRKMHVCPAGTRYPHYIVTTPLHAFDVFTVTPRLPTGCWKNLPSVPRYETVFHDYCKK